MESLNRLCLVCGKEIVGRRSDAICCSKKCSDAKPRNRVKNPEISRRYYENLKSDSERYAANLRKARERNRRLKDWINAYKIARGCVDCGYDQHAVALDIDHINGKTANIANLKSIEAVEAEIERHNCVVRCANCHRIKSWKTESWRI